MMIRPYSPDGGGFVYSVGANNDSPLRGIRWTHAPDRLAAATPSSLEGELKDAILIPPLS